VRPAVDYADVGMVLVRRELQRPPDVDQHFPRCHHVLVTGLAVPIVPYGAEAHNHVVPGYAGFVVVLEEVAVQDEQIGIVQEDVTSLRRVDSTL